MRIELGIRQSEAHNDRAAEDTFRAALEAIRKLERERDAALRELASLREAIQKRHDERQAQVQAFKERFPDYDATCDFATEYATLLKQPK